MRWWLALLLAACREDLPKAELVNDLRILAVRADPAEAAVGETVSLQALVVHPDEAIAVERVWLACVTAGAVTATGCLEETLPPPCAADPEARVCLLSTGDTTAYRIPTIARSQVVVTLAAALVDEGGVVACAQALAGGGGVPGFCRVSIKRVNVIAPGTAPNVNPSIDALSVDGERLTVSLSGVEAGEQPFCPGS